MNAFDFDEGLVFDIITYEDSILKGGLSIETYKNVTERNNIPLTSRGNL